MKKTIRTLLVLIPAALTAATSCNKDADGSIYRPNSDDGREIHFSVSSVEKSFGKDDRNGLIEISLVRPGTVGTHEIQLSQMGADQSIFRFPETVTIEDGDCCTIVPVIVDLESCVKGMSYSTSLYIVGRDQATGNYAVHNSSYTDAVSISASIDLDWKLMLEDPDDEESAPKTANFIYNAYWTGYRNNITVECAEYGDYEYYRLTSWNPNNVTFTWLKEKGGDRCIVPKQNTGVFNSTYGQYIMVSDYPTNGSSETYTYENYPCTYDSRTDTYSFNLIYYREGSTSYFRAGVETLTINGTRNRTPSVGIMYEGVDTTATGLIGAKLSFDRNAYTSYYDVSFYDGTSADGEPARTATLYEDDSRSWGLAYGPHKVVATAYDSEGNPGETTSLVFTFDPEGDYTTHVKELKFYCDSSATATYDPTSSLHFVLRTTNLKGGWYKYMRKTEWETLIKTNTEAEIITAGTKMSSDFITKANSASGTHRVINGSLSAGTEYVIGFVMENQYGEQIVRTAEAKTRRGAANVESFDSDVTMDDFLGSFMMKADVGSSAESNAPMSYMVGINRLDEYRVVISGLAGASADFDPVVIGYYDGNSHCISVDFQNTGIYNGIYPQFAIYVQNINKGTYALLYSGGYKLGMVDGKYEWVGNVSDPSTYTVVGYTFMEFSGLPAVSDNYLRRRVDSKTYMHLSMTKL